MVCWIVNAQLQGKRVKRRKPLGRGRRTGVWRQNNEINFLLAVLAILQPTNTDSLWPWSISIGSDMALQCLSVQQLRDMSRRACEHCRGNGSTEHRYAVFCCVKLGNSATTTHGKLHQAFGDDTVPRARAIRWHNVFSEGRTVAGDKQGSGRPSATRTGDNAAQSRDLFDPIEDKQSKWLLMKLTWTGKPFVGYWIKN